MIQFRGREKMTVDAKGRTSVPVRFREVLDETYPAKQARQLIVVPWFDGNLRIFPQPVWEEKQDQFDALFHQNDIFALDELDSDLRRFLYCMALDLPIYPHGRVDRKGDVSGERGLTKEEIGRAHV